MTVAAGPLRARREPRRPAGRLSVGFALRALLGATLATTPMASVYAVGAAADTATSAAGASGAGTVPPPASAARAASGQRTMASADARRTAAKDTAKRAAFEVYRVKPKDTLYDIAVRYLTNPNDWKVLQRINGVTDPRDLHAYATLRVPAALLKRTPLFARVLSVNGQVETAGDDGRYMPLRVGTELGQGSRLRTGRDASVALELPDGSHIVLPSSSSITITRLRSTPMTGVVERRFELKQGEVDTEATPLVKPRDTFEIISPSVVAGVRGTQFRVNYHAERETTAVEVTEGKVRVAGATPRALQGEQLVPAGFGNLTALHGETGAPIRLLPAPDLRDAGKVQDEPHVAFDIAPVDGAHAYRAQIGKDAGLLRIVRDRQHDSPHIDFGDLPDGSYFVRVAAIDAAGLQGMSQVYAFERRKNGLSTSAGPLPEPGTYEFRWIGSRTDTPTRYRFMLGTTPDLSRPMLDVFDVADSHIVVSHLPPGRYYWTVIAEQFDHGRFYSKASPTQSFTLAP